MRTAFHIRHRRSIRLIALVLLALGTMATPVAEAAPDHRGVQLHSLWSSTSSDDMDRELDLARRAGAGVVRVDVGWSSLEQRGKGQLSSWYLNRLDRFMAGANSRGMKVIATLWSTPCWASSAPEELKQGCAGSWWDRGVTQYAPTNMADYGDIVRWMTARYGSNLAALEVWNEPTLTGTRFWIAPDRAAAYADLLAAAYPAAKAGDAGVQVLATLDGTDEDFLKAIYRHGARGSYDGLGVHPYGDRDFSQLRALRDVQRQHGDDAPLWLTEFGWATGKGEPWAVSEEEQATRITQAFAQLASWDWVRAVVLYELRDEGTDQSEREHNWGVVRRDFSPKAGFVALRAALSGEAPPAPGTLPAPGATLPPVDKTVPPPPSSDPVPPPPAETPAPDEGGDDEVSLSVERRGTVQWAIGEAPANADVEIKREKCNKSEDSTVTVQASSDGTFKLSLGRRKALRDCKFSASLA